MPWLDPYYALWKETGGACYVPTKEGIDKHAPGWVTLMLELHDEVDIVKQLQDLETLSPSGQHLRSAHSTSSFVTLQCRLEVAAQLETANWIKQIALAQPLRAQDPAAPYAPQQLPKQVEVATSQVIVRKSEVLAACIDYGCAFASPAVLRADGTTRVVALWDQGAGDGASPDFANLQPEAKAPQGMGYGRLMMQSELTDWVREFQVIHGLQKEIDEQRCYRAAPYSALLDDMTHGTHVLGRFVDPAYGPTKGDLAADCDIAFVQLARNVAYPGTAGAVNASILDGLRFIQKFATENGYKRCVVVCSYGSNVGSHDGTGLFESAVAALLNDIEEKDCPIELVFSAGNSANQHVHAVLMPDHASLKGKSGAAPPPTLEWLLPSANCSPSFAEVWCFAEDKGTVEFFVDGTPVPAAATMEIHPWLHANCSTTPDGQLVLTLQAHATQTWFKGEMCAPPGAVRITARVKEGETLRRPIHAYTSLGFTSPGFPPRMEQSTWRVPNPSESAWKLSAAGSLQGAGSIKSDHVRAIGAYIGGALPQWWQPADYSSYGPSRASAKPNEIYCLALGDESPSVPGVPGPGCIGKSVRYMSGTSVAAPQFGRVLLNSSPYQSRATVPIGKGYLNLAKQNLSVVRPQDI